LADCTQSLALSPDDDITLRNRGLTYLKLEDFDHALADYEAALRVNPSRARARSLYGRGLAKQGKGDISGAYDLAAALELDPGIAEEFAGYGVR
jgi:tetratricopeptide (TPR) repeat protein